MEWTTELNMLTSYIHNSANKNMFNEFKNALKRKVK